MNKCLRTIPYSTKDDLPLCKGSCMCILLPNEDVCECCEEKKHTGQHIIEGKQTCGYCMKKALHIYWKINGFSDKLFGKPTKGNLIQDKNNDI